MRGGWAERALATLSEALGDSRAQKALMAFKESWDYTALGNHSEILCRLDI